jgi:hypothetical protein
MATTTTPAANEAERIRAIAPDLPDLGRSSRDEVLA